ncbi:MAG: hypothetical protein D9V47_00065 [Clostridia bacterium]|nr:MAG: hypothetical protein D9V47_00065 [Clostridia bacterium]
MAAFLIRKNAFEQLSVELQEYEGKFYVGFQILARSEPGSDAWIPTRKAFRLRAELLPVLINELQKLQEGADGESATV